MTTTADRPDPGRLMQMSWSFAAPLLVEAGVRTGLFDLLETEARTIEQTAAATGASTRGLAVLMCALAGLELLHRDEAGRFGLTPESAAFLVSSKPEANLGRIFSHISTQLIPAWLDLVEVIRTGRPARRDDLLDKGTFFASFVESILPLGWPAASALAEYLRLCCRGLSGSASPEASRSLTRLETYTQISGQYARAINPISTKSLANFH